MKDSCARGRDYLQFKHWAESELQEIASRRAEAKRFLCGRYKGPEDLPLAENARNTEKECDRRTRELYEEIRKAEETWHRYMRGIDYLHDNILIDCGVLPGFGNEPNGVIVGEDPGNAHKAVGRSGGSARGSLEENSEHIQKEETANAAPNGSDQPTPNPRPDTWALMNQNIDGKQRALRHAQENHDQHRLTYRRQFGEYVAQQFGRVGVDFAHEFGPIFVRRGQELTHALKKAEDEYDHAIAQAKEAGVNIVAVVPNAMANEYLDCEELDAMVMGKDEQRVQNWRNDAAVVTINVDPRPRSSGAAAISEREDANATEKTVRTDLERGEGSKSTQELDRCNREASAGTPTDKDETTAGNNDKACSVCPATLSEEGANQEIRLKNHDTDGDEPAYPRDKGRPETAPEPPTLFENANTAASRGDAPLIGNIDLDTPLPSNDGSFPGDHTNQETEHRVDSQPIESEPGSICDASKKEIVDSESKKNTDNANNRPEAARSDEASGQKIHTPVEAMAERRQEKSHGPLQQKEQPNSSELLLFDEDNAGSLQLPTEGILNNKVDPTSAEWNAETGAPTSKAQEEEADLNEID